MGGNGGPPPSVVPPPTVTVPNGIGHFVDVSPTLPWAVQQQPPGPVQDPVPEIVAVVLADLDGDGRDEVIVSPRWAQPTRAPVVFRWADPGLVVAPITLPDGVDIRGAADMDGDGTVDLVAEGPYILWGDGHGGFGPAVPLFDPTCNLGQGTGPTVPVNCGSVENDPFALADMNGDGWLDVLQFYPGPASVDQAVEVFVRTGPRSFTLTPDLLDLVSRSNCDSMGVAEIQGSPTLVLNVNHGTTIPLPMFFQRGSDGRWHSTDLLPPGAASLGIAEGAPMASTACDLNGDGRQDYVVMLDPQTDVFQGTSSGLLLDRSDTAGLLAPSPVPGYVYPPMAWAGACLDLDGDGRTEIIQACGNDVGGFIDPRHDSGPQPIRAWTRVGDTWQMGDLTQSLGLGQLGQWHSLTVGDIDGDGAPDLASGGFGVAPRVLVNRLGVPTAAVRLRTPHGQPAYNVHVDVPAGPGRAAEHLISSGNVSPLAQPDAIVFVPGGTAVTLGGTRNAVFVPGHGTTVTMGP